MGSPLSPVVVNLFMERSNLQWTYLRFGGDLSNIPHFPPINLRKRLSSYATGIFGPVPHRPHKKETSDPVPLADPFYFAGWKRTVFHPATKGGRDAITTAHWFVGIPGLKRVRLYQPNYNDLPLSEVSPESVAVSIKERTSTKNFDGRGIDSQN
ncbi:hypothetical protein Trydic_g5806 [Trypoxylus dichotomus]